MATHTLVQNWTDGVNTLSSSIATTAGLSKEWTETIADSETDKQVTANIDVSALKSLYILSDQDMTLETNSGSTPDDTIALKANKPVVWESSSGYFSNPLTADVTALFFTNASGSAANLKIRTLEDPTP